MKLYTLTIAAAAPMLLMSAVFALTPAPASDTETAESTPPPVQERLVQTLCQLGGIHQVRCLSYSGRPRDTVFPLAEPRQDK